MDKNPRMITKFDAIIRSDRWAPRFGWHDDHRDHDRTPAYLPAMMQVRAEVEELLGVLWANDVLGGKCLQLGMGECDASHAAWRTVFGRVVTLDFRVFADNEASNTGRDVRRDASRGFAALRAPFDFLLIDAGHKLDDVRADHGEYGALVRRGGIIAFHDALKRLGYEDEIDVWRYLEGVPDVTMIGSEVGIAWLVKR